MKKIFTAALLGLLTLASCQSGSKRITINGTVTGLKNDTLYVNYTSVTDLNGENLRTDTIVSQQGKFTYHVESDTVPMRFSFLNLTGKNMMQAVSNQIEVLALPGQTLTVKGSMGDYVVEGKGSTCHIPDGVNVRAIDYYSRKGKSFERAEWLCKFALGLVLEQKFLVALAKVVAKRQLVVIHDLAAVLFFVKQFFLQNFCSAFFFAHKIASSILSICASMSSPSSLVRAKSVWLTKKASSNCAAMRRSAASSPISSRAMMRALRVGLLASTHTVLKQSFSAPLSKSCGASNTVSGCVLALRAVFKMAGWVMAFKSCVLSGAAKALSASFFLSSI